MKTIAIGKHFGEEVTVTEVFTQDSIGLCIDCGQRHYHGCNAETQRNMCKVCHHPTVYGMEALAERGLLIVKREE